MPFPTTGLLDDFNRANEGPPPTGWSTPIYTGQVGLQVISNALESAAAVGVWQDAYWSTSFGNDVEVYATVAALGSTANGQYMWCRLQATGLGTSGTGYTARYIINGASNTVQLQRYNAGSPTTLATSASFTIGVGDSLGVEAIGNWIRVLWKPSSTGIWQTVCQAYDTTYKGGYIGFETNDPTIRWDDVGGGTVVTGTASAVPLGNHPMRSVWLRSTQQFVKHWPGDAGPVVWTDWSMEPGVGGTSDLADFGGAVTGGYVASARVSSVSAGAIAGGAVASARVTAVSGGAVAGGNAASERDIATSAGAVAGGFVASARVTSVLAGAVAGGTPASERDTAGSAGAVVGGFVASARVTATMGGAVAGGFATEEVIPGGAAAGGFAATGRVTASVGGAQAGGSPLSARNVAAAGGGTAGGYPASARTVATGAGATAGGFAATARVTSVSGGALAGGFAASAKVTATSAGATAGGFTLAERDVASSGGATAAGFAASARVSSVLAGALAGGFAAAARATATAGGAVCGGSSPTVRVGALSGGAVAGGFALGDQVSPGGASAGGFTPTVRVSADVGGGNTGGFSSSVRAFIDLPGGAVTGGYPPLDSSPSSFRLQTAGFTGSPLDDPTNAHLSLPPGSSHLVPGGSSSLSSTVPRAPLEV